MKHSILILLVLGFTQNLQAELNINLTSKPLLPHNNKDSQKETTFQKDTPTALVDDQKEQSERIPAQASDKQILSAARFCIANFTRVEDQFSVICNGLRLSKLKDRGIKTISKVGHYLIGAGFTPLSCWSSGSAELSKLHIYCAYYKR